MVGRIKFPDSLWPILKVENTIALKWNEDFKLCIINLRLSALQFHNPNSKKNKNNLHDILAQFRFEWNWR